jgi:hypothetical protein
MVELILMKAFWAAIIIMNHQIQRSKWQSAVMRMVSQSDDCNPEFVCTVFPEFFKIDWKLYFHAFCITDIRLGLFLQKYHLKISFMKAHHYTGFRIGLSAPSTQLYSILSAGGYMYHPNWKITQNRLLYYQIRAFPSKKIPFNSLRTDGDFGHRNCQIIYDCRNLLMTIVWKALEELWWYH